MAKFTVEFSTDNAAFVEEEGNGVHEVSDCLIYVASQVKDGRTSGPVIDTNGNTVGRWGWEK